MTEIDTHELTRLVGAAHYAALKQRSRRRRRRMLRLTNDLAAIVNEYRLANSERRGSNTDSEPAESA